MADLDFKGGRVMRVSRWWGVFLILSVGVLASARWSLLAQERGARGPVRGKAEREAAAPPVVSPKPGSVSIQEALLRPLDLPFGEETTLEEVRSYLGKALGAPVVLDRAALGRLELVPEDTIQLDLKGVRLKVGLGLLLDQVGLSYRVVAEDNLLILTDPEGSDDPSKRVQAELKSLHRELHDLQDSVNDLLDLVEEEFGVEPDQPKHSSPLVKLSRSAKAPRRGHRSPVSRTRSGVGG